MAISLGLRSPLPIVPRGRAEDPPSEAFSRLLTASPSPLRPACRRRSAHCRSRPRRRIPVRARDWRWFCGSARSSKAMRSPAGLVLQERLLPAYIALLHQQRYARNTQLNALDADCDVRFSGFTAGGRRRTGFMTQHPPNKPLRICSLVRGPFQHKR